MFRPPCLEVLVLGEDRIDYLIEHVVGRLAEELGVGEQRFVRLAIQPDDVPDQLLASRTWFDERHAASMNDLR
jgi:hypothetical protein